MTTEGQNSNRGTHIFKDYRWFQTGCRGPGTTTSSISVPLIFSTKIIPEMLSTTAKFKNPKINTCHPGTLVTWEMGIHWNHSTNPHKLLFKSQPNSPFL